MKLGTDVNIWTCRAEGYPVIEYKKNDLFKAGELDKDCQVRVTVSNPHNWTNEGKPIIGHTSKELWLVNDTVCFSALVEIFEGYGDNIKSFCDWASCPIDLNTPNENDFLSLVSAIDSYSGLATWGLGPN